MGTLDKTYFHIAPSLLEPGSIINPGNWGRIITFVGMGHTSFSREILLEYARIRSFKDKPSRFSSNFACENLDEAKFYRQNTSQTTSVIYEVEVVNKHAKHHIGCYNMLPLVVNQYPSNHEQIAHDYWNGNNSFSECGNYKCNELVIESPFKIISKVA